MIFAVPTIKHTGSKLTADHILGRFNQVPIQHEPEGDTIYFNHITPHTVPVFKGLLEKYPAIIPLRSPYKVALSWKKNGQPIEEMCETWELLIDEIDPFEPNYLPIDIEDRDSYLAEINKKYDLDLETDWPVVNHRSKEVRLTIEELAIIDEMCYKNHGFMSRFYA